MELFSKVLKPCPKYQLRKAVLMIHETYSRLCQQFLLVVVFFYSNYWKADYATKTLVTLDMVNKNHSVQGTTVLKEFINPNMYVVLTLFSAPPGSEEKPSHKGFAESELY